MSLVMDKKILIALGLISAFSIDNATGMNGIIENPSVNESQSMKTINDFSYDLRSLGPVNRLFDLTYWSPQKWQEALHEVSEVVDFYWTHPDADMTACMHTYHRLFVYDNETPNFINTPECNKESLDTLTKIFHMALRSLGGELTRDIRNAYFPFSINIKEIGLRDAMLAKDRTCQTGEFVNKLVHLLYYSN